MEVLKVGTVALGGEAVVFRILDLDAVGAPIGQLPHAGRAGAHACQIDDFES